MSMNGRDDPRYNHRRMSHVWDSFERPGVMSEVLTLAQTEATALEEQRTRADEEDDPIFFQRLLTDDEDFDPDWEDTIRDHMDGDDEYQPIVVRLDRLTEAHRERELLKRHISRIDRASSIIIARYPSRNFGRMPRSKNHRIGLIPRD